MNSKIDVKEEQIRPRALFDKFLRLAEKDAKVFFKNVAFARIKCPACQSNKSDFVFKKNGFSFEVCPECQALFVNPRPKFEVFDGYYRKGKSIKFLSDCFYKSTDSARKRMVHQPKLRLLDGLLSRFYSKQEKIMLVDIGAGSGTFCSEFMKVNRRGVEVCAIEPSPHMAKACKDKGIKVINKPFEAVARLDFDKSYKKIFTCFELVEHLADTEKFFTTCRNLLGQKEIIVFTTLNGLGFDIQLLWEKSKSVFPPHHLNFFNPNSIAILMERYGFRILEISTPGRLDVDIIRNSLGSLSDEKFWVYFLGQLGKDGQDSLQRLLQQYNLSSHMAVVAQKKSGRA